MEEIYKKYPNSKDWLKGKMDETKRQHYLRLSVMMIEEPEKYKKMMKDYIEMLE